jgi:methylated-DNA-[protein]-cysteine S-methyltransferase
MMNHSPDVLLLGRLPTPIGMALLVTDQEERIRALDFGDYETRMRRLLTLHCGAVTLREGAAPATHVERIAQYFAGRLDALAGMPCVTGGTPFQRRVWAALLSIPVGGTINYGELAARIGRPGAARAVGMANGANPISVIVPCHRVIGADGLLTGYGGGLPRKQWLLTHEGAWPKHAAAKREAYDGA